MYNPISIAGRNIVVTGAASGIGRQCSIDFAKSGANLILVDINGDDLNTVAVECESYGVKTFCCACDLTDEMSLTDKIDIAVRKMGLIHGLLHAAGIEKTLPFNKLTSDDYQRIYSVNVISGLKLVGLLSKKKYRADHAKFVLIASITSVVGRPGVAAYAASKGALVSAVKTVALELAPKGMTVNCISPGTILTPLMESLLATLPEEQRQERMSGFPLGLGRPSDVALSALFLLSDGARWITGQNIIVDGGYTSR